LALLQAGFSHEFITPIKSISTFAQELMLLIQNTDLKYKAELIFQTSQMLHSQVKIMLDKSMIDQQAFQA
jgi:hypothetical protein